MGPQEGAPLWDFGCAGGGFPHCITTAALTLFKPLKILNMPVTVAQPTVHIFAYFQKMTGNCYPKSLLQIRRGRWGTRQKLVRENQEDPALFPNSTGKRVGHSVSPADPAISHTGVTLAAWVRRLRAALDWHRLLVTSWNALGPWAALCPVQPCKSPRGQGWHARTHAGLFHQQCQAGLRQLLSSVVPLFSFLTKLITFPSSKSLFFPFCFSIYLLSKLFLEKDTVSVSGSKLLKEKTKMLIVSRVYKKQSECELKMIYHKRKKCLAYNFKTTFGVRKTQLPVATVSCDSSYRAGWTLHLTAHLQLTRLQQNILASKQQWIVSRTRDH